VRITTIKFSKKINIKYNIEQKVLGCNVMKIFTKVVEKNINTDKKKHIFFKK